MSAVEHLGPVRFAFDRCEPPTMVRALMAAVDHLCALRDLDIDLLQALEVPIGETVVSLSEFGITGVVVSVDTGHLHVTITTAEPLPTTDAALFGDDGDIVGSFFGHRVSTDRASVALTGSLT